MILLPSRIRLSMTCVVCGPSGTSSLYVVSTLEPSCACTYRRPLSCACDQPLSLWGPTYIQAALSAAAFFCVLAEPVETPSARINAAASANGRARVNFLFFMFSSLLYRGAARDYRAADGRCLVGSFGEPCEGPGEHVDGQLDVRRQGLLLRRMADPTVQAADEEHRRRDACARERGRVVSGSRGELDDGQAPFLELGAEGADQLFGHRDRLEPEVRVELELRDEAVEARPVGGAGIDRDAHTARAHVDRSGLDVA